MDLEGLVEHLEPLFLAAARRVNYALADDLAADALLAWLELYHRDQGRALAVTQQSDARIALWATWRCRDAWRRYYADEPEPDPDPQGEPPMPVPARVRQPGERAPGHYIANRADLFHLFRQLEEVDGIDLQALYDGAREEDQIAIRKLASGYAAHEIGSWWYRCARDVLRRAAA